jgi:uncharacterized protein YoxC
MTEMPTWMIWTWMILSSLFFLLNLAVFAVLVIVLLKLKEVLEDLRPKIAQLAARVDGIGQRVEEIAISTRTTVDTVGGRARSIVGSAQHVSETASRQFERYSPIIVGVATGLKLLSAVRAYRKEDAEEESPRNGQGDRRPKKRRKGPSPIGLISLGWQLYSRMRQ